MARKKLPEIMTPSEVADALGVRIQNLGKVKDLPECDQRTPLSKTRIWRADVIREFAAKRQPEAVRKAA